MKFLRSENDLEEKKISIANSKATEDTVSETK